MRELDCNYVEMLTVDLGFQVEAVKLVCVIELIEDQITFNEANVLYSTVSKSRFNEVEVSDQVFELIEDINAVNLNEEESDYLSNLLWGIRVKLDTEDHGS